MKTKIIIELDDLDSFVDSDSKSELDDVLTKYSLNEFGTNRGYIIHNYGGEYKYKINRKRIQESKEREENGKLVKKSFN
jgi:hypothetical protein